MKNIDAFSGYNPVVNFTFYMGAVVFGVVFVHPVFLICSFTMSLLHYFILKGSRAVKFLLGMVPVFILVSAVNPIFNTRGSHVLFTYFGNRPYTLEALLYGMAVAAMFISILLWFASYSLIITSDKFIYIFGNLIPHISLILVMSMRLVTRLRIQAVRIFSARKNSGRNSENSCDVKFKIREALITVSALTSWALEQGVVTSDSMQSRGYGSGKRTDFSIFSFSKRDKILLTVFIVLLTIMIVFTALGGAEASYTPEIHFSGNENIYFFPCIISYFIFLFMPSALDIAEDLKWHVLKSKI